MADENVVLTELRDARNREDARDQRLDDTLRGMTASINSLVTQMKVGIYSKGEPATERVAMGTLFTVVGGLAAIGGFALSMIVSDVSAITAAMSKDNERERTNAVAFASVSSEQEARIRFLESAVHERVRHESH